MFCVLTVCCMIMVLTGKTVLVCSCKCSWCFYVFEKWVNWTPNYKGCVPGVFYDSGHVFWTQDNVSEVLWVFVTQDVCSGHKTMYQEACECFVTQDVCFGHKTMCQETCECFVTQDVCFGHKTICQETCECLWHRTCVLDTRQCVKRPVSVWWHRTCVLDTRQCVKRPVSVFDTGRVLWTQDNGSSVCNSELTLSYLCSGSHCA